MFKSDSKLFQYSTAYRPFFYPWAIDIAVAHEKIHWVEQEATLEDDIADWKRDNLTISEKEFITQILRMFTQSDVSVGRFYYEFLIPTFKNNEIRNMLGSFAAREAVHQRAYALLNDSLGLPEGEYAAFLEYKEMADKADFMLDADPSTKSGLGLTLAKSVFNEGVSLFASFVMLLNFQRNGLMKGMGKVVEWSINDETKHVEGITQLFRVFCEDHPNIVTDPFKRSIYDMARNAVALEDKFIDLAFGMGEVRGLTKDEVKQYIRYIADRRLIQLGLKPNFMVDRNPLPWLDFVLNAPDHTNFFEGRVTEYEVGSLTGSYDYDKLTGYKVIKKDGCPYCDRLGLLFSLNGVEAETLNASKNLAMMEMFRENGWTFPRVWHNNELIGGAEDTALFLGMELPPKEALSVA